MSDRYRYVLDEKNLPTAWYNVAADLPEPLPPYLGPDGEPIRPEQLAAIFPPGLLEQELSQERFIDIPGPVLDLLRTYRPSALTRARLFEKALGLPENIHIYYKYEGGNASGSHKANSAIPQAYYNKQAGIRKLTTETGAGQWGTALAMACAQVGLELDVYMVRVSFEQKPYRRILMETFGASVYASPSTRTQAGRSFLSASPETPGSLAMAISEAVEVALQDPGTNYSLGSVLNHVCLHQTIIGQEAIRQMELAEDEPDVVIGCFGGGSNFAGLALPYYHRRLQGLSKARLLAVEPLACPSLTCGEYRHDLGDASGMTPLLPMYTLGYDFVPAGIHAGGLRYHGGSPLVSALVKAGQVEAVAVPQSECFSNAVLFARAEALLPAPESSHAIAAAVREARAAAEAGQARTILFNLSGNGYLDLAAYDAWNQGQLRDYDYAARKVI
jgi:tryptophan synthase beta chain